MEWLNLASEEMWSKYQAMTQVERKKGEQGWQTLIGMPGITADPIAVSDSDTCFTNYDSSMIIKKQTW